MKKGWLLTTFLCILFIICFNYRDDIVKVVMQLVNKNKQVVLPDSNNYDNKIDFEFVKRTDDFHIKNYQNMLDAIYTILDNGTEEFTFYCDDSYEKCMDDFNKVSNDAVLLSTINNMVSPYNSYDKIYFKSTNYGMITMKIDKQYSKDEILKEGDIIAEAEFESGKKS